MNLFISKYITTTSGSLLLSTKIICNYIYSVGVRFSVWCLWIRMFNISTSAVALTAWGTGAHAGHGGTTRRRTNKKMAKLYWPSRKRLPNQLIVLLEPKSGGARRKLFSRRFVLHRCPPPPLSNSFRRHWKSVDIVNVTFLRFSSDELTVWRVDCIPFYTCTNSFLKGIILKNLYSTFCCRFRLAIYISHVTTEAGHTVMVIIILGWMIDAIIRDHF